MAYLSKEKTNEIRENLKKAFPSKDGWKFSIRNENYSTISVAIMEAPMRFSDKDYEQFNPFYPENYMNADTLTQILDIMNNGNFDKSDIMTDYHHVGWYRQLSQGTWDKPFVLSTGKKSSTHTAVAPKAARVSDTQTQKAA